MGYTHYWSRTRPFTDAEWADLTVHVRDVLARTKVKLAYEYDEPARKPEVSDQMIRFNGVGTGGCETFVLKRSPPQPFNFCKTNGKPYDDIVTAILTLAREVAPDALQIKSDGDREDWNAGMKLASEVFGRDVSCPVTPREE